MTFEELQEIESEICKTKYPVLDIKEKYETSKCKAMKRTIKKFKRDIVKHFDLKVNIGGYNTENFLIKVAIERGLFYEI
jgi:hypothetical protein